MTLTLRIINFDALQTGGPTWVTLDQRGASIGRRSSMDWVLPDPSKHISGHHFDVAFRDGTYWLTDVSTNGTYLQGQRQKLEGPQHLSGGERLIVGHYVIEVDVRAPELDRTIAGEGIPASLPSDAPDPWAPKAGVNQPEPPGDVAEQHPLDNVEGAFAPLQRPTLPPGKYTIPARPPGSVGGVQQPPGASVGSAPLSHPPFVPPPKHPTDIGGQHVALTPVPPISRTPTEPADPADLGRAVIEAFCRGAGLSFDTAQGVDPVVLSEALGRSARRSADEIMNMLRDRASVKQFTRGGERTMLSATGNNPMKFLPDSEQAMEAMFLRPRDGFMTGPDGFQNALQDLRLHQMAVFAALQPALAKVFEGLAPEDIEGPEPASGNLLGNAKGRYWDTFVNRWDEKAEQGEHGMIDAFLQAFALAYMEASKAEKG